MAAFFLDSVVIIFFFFFFLTVTVLLLPVLLSCYWCDTILLLTQNIVSTDMQYWILEWSCW